MAEKNSSPEKNNLHDRKDKETSHNTFQTIGTTHDHTPDYSRPPLVIDPEIHERIFQRLCFLYSRPIAKAYMPELERILKVYYAHKSKKMRENDDNFVPEERFTENDVILITYGDLLTKDNEKPLITLANFCDRYLEGGINTIHILPFFPYSSDKGFSIIDFSSVDPKLGTWDDIEELESRYQLMFDGVINHVSSQSRWFQEFANGKSPYKDFFITYKSPDELSDEERQLIFRPRTSDILSKFQTINGERFVWTTFSEDQIDLNYKNPNVLMRVIDILLTYVRHGADIIRLDAVTYLWAEPGTRCVHLEQTHELVKLCRDILEAIAPGVALITETNVPHNENISYFGNGNDEAQMVYNFALPPLVLHTFYREDATAISKWAQELDVPSKTTTFFNFLDSHDGVGVMAVKGILEKEDVDYIVKRAGEHGAYISYKTTSENTEEPYEINVTWFSALNRIDSGEDISYQVKRFIASRAAALVLKGVPGIYLHGLIGTDNDIEAVLKTKTKRDINRTVLDCEAIIDSLRDKKSKISQINNAYGHLITIRTNQKAFHPNSDQECFLISKSIFCILRKSLDKKQHILSLINVTNRSCKIEIDLNEIGIIETHWYDLVNEIMWMSEDHTLLISMEPYDVFWLQPDSEIKK